MWGYTEITPFILIRIANFRVEIERSCFLQFKIDNILDIFLGYMLWYFIEFYKYILK